MSSDGSSNGPEQEAHRWCTWPLLVGTLFGALMLRTQMVQNSFEAAQIETNINRLTQDIEDDQAKLDQLVANLPDKASDMGMVPQQGSVSIDLSGYQSNKGGTQ